LATVSIGVLIVTLPLPDSLGLTALIAAGLVVASVTRGSRAATLAVTLAFSFRATLALIQAYVSPLPISGADDERFIRWATAWSEGGLSSLHEHFALGAKLYIWLIALAYSVFVPSLLLVISINVLFGTLIVWTVYQLSLQLWGVRAARRAAIITALFPVLAMYSAVSMREVAVGYPLVLGVFMFARWRLDYRLRWVIGAVIAFAVASAFHSGAAVLILVAMLLVIEDWKSHLSRARTVSLLRTTLALSFCGLLFAAMLSTGRGLEKFGGDEVATIGEIEGYQVSTARGRTAYLQNLTIRTPLDLVWQSPIRVGFFLFGPFVWQIRSPLDLFASAEGLIYLLLAWPIFRNRRRIWRNSGARGTLILMGSLVLVFALASSNYGTAMRHRAKAVPVMIALAAGAWATPKRRFGQSVDSESVPAVEDTVAVRGLA
jgi:4-amino-4-deoxy-L-arabinose transferase-like glycosyltransferase